MADSNPLQHQAHILWNMLDDLAETNPEGYSKFMDNFLKQKEWFKSPTPVFCFKTQKLPETSNHHIFINICKWDKVPAPQNENEKISVVASELRDLPDCDGKQSVIDLCFHIDIMNETGKLNEWQKIIASIALEYVEKQSELQLSKAYKILTIKYKGEEEELNNFLLRMKKKPKKPVEKLPAGNEKPAENEKPSVLHGLSNIANLQGVEKDPSGLLGNLEGSVGHREVGKSDLCVTKKPLIEEVTPAAKVTQVPKHSVELLKATSGSTRCIVIKIDLPKVCSGSECELDVSKEDLLLSSPHYSKLHIQFQEKGNEDETTSTFNKTSRQLTVKIPVQS